MNAKDTRKRKQAPQSEANVCRHKCNLKNLAFLLQRTPNNAQNTQQKLGVAFRRTQQKIKPILN